jgi:hypothetical protein
MFGCHVAVLDERRLDEVPIAVDGRIQVAPTALNLKIRLVAAQTDSVQYTVASLV